MKEAKVAGLKLNLHITTEPILDKNKRASTHLLMLG
jgi:hypothetical protein